MSLTTAIRDGKPVQWVLEINGVARSDGTAVTRYYSKGFNRDDGTIQAAARIEDISAFGEALPIEDPLRLSGVAEIPEVTVFLGDDPLAIDGQGALRSEIEDVQWENGEAVLWLVPVDEAWTSAEAQLTTTVRGEPAWEGRQYRIELDSPTEALDVPVEVPSHVGIPTCWEAITNPAIAIAANNSVYDLTAFTVALRVRILGNTQGINLFRRGVASDRQFTLDLNATGTIGFNCSSGGTAFQVSLTSSDTYDDGEWHWVVGSVDPGRHAYLMVDGELVAEDAGPATPDLPSEGLVLAIRDSGALCDVRFYAGYMPTEEARTEMAQRSDSARAVGMWRADDGSGSTITDYSSTSNDATISGTEGVNWDWVSSDLGEPELAGRPYPLLGGLVVHAPAHRINANLERYRVADIAPPELLDMRQQGDVISTPAWTDEGGGVIEWTAAASEPVTQSRRAATASLSYPGAILERLISAASGYPDRGGPAVSAGSIDRLDYLLRYACGYYSDTQPSLGEIAGAVIGEAGGYLVAGRAGGEWDVGYLLPPVGPGPYSGTGFYADDLGVLSFPGGQTSPAPHVDFGDVADLPAGSHTIAVWYKSHKVDVNPSAIGSSLSAGNAQPGPIIATKIFGGDGYHISQLAVTDDDPRALSVVIPQLSTKELRTPPVVQFDRWALLISVWDSAAGTWTLYHGVRGSSGGPAQVAQATSVTGSPGGTTQLLRIGGNGNFWSFLGSIAHFQIFGSALSSAERLNLFDPSSGSPAIASAYAPLTEGSGEPVEQASSATGTLTGVTWAPEQTIDLRASGRLELRRRLRPAGQIAVAWGRNYRPLTDADLSGSVTDAERQILTQEQQWVRPKDPSASPQPPRVWLAPWFDETGARIQAALMADRLQGEHWIARVGGHDLRGVFLRIGSEARLLHPEVESTANWRVIGRTIDPNTGETSLVFWR